MAALEGLSQGAIPSYLRCQEAKGDHSRDLACEGGRMQPRPKAIVSFSLIPHEKLLAGQLPVSLVVDEREESIYSLYLRI